MRWPWQKKTLGPLDLALDLLRETASKTGLRVTWETALQASTALACDRVIAEGLAQVPLKLYRGRAGGGADPATDHPLYDVVATAPNDWLTSFEWRETAGMHLSVLNRAYAYINRVSIPRAQRIELLPLTPQQVRTERGENYRTRYFVTFSAGQAEQEVPAENILHLRGPSWNAWEGLDGVKLAREAIGLALATEEHGARLFKNGAIVGGILSTEATLAPEQQRGLKASWQEAQSGLENAYRTAVLWGGLKWQPRAQQNDQAQWVEVRRFQVQEVCRFKRVLPIMVGEADKTATYASSEQMFLAHVVHTMGPWYTRIEQRLNLQLLTPEERRERFFFKHNVNALMRGAHRDRAEFYRVMHGIGAMNDNEIRAFEDMNPYPGGDVYLQPLNMVPAGTQPAEPATAPNAK
jgi:HK97 family phage portal protein